MVKRNFFPSLAMSLMLAGCGTLPQYRSDRTLPWAEVYAQINCEFKDAIFLLAAKQDSKDYAHTIKNALPLPNFTASVVLKESASRGSGGFLGGELKSLGSETNYTTFNGGSASRPGLGMTEAASQFNEGTRYIALKDIVAFAPGSRQHYVNVTNSPIVTYCGKFNRQKDGITDIGIRRKLGIYERLIRVLDEVKIMPIVVNEQQLNFEFEVSVDAGGTITFTQPSGNLGVSLGAGSSYKETLLITITRDPKAS